MDSFSNLLSRFCQNLLITYLTATSFSLNYNPGVAQLVGCLILAQDAGSLSPPPRPQKPLFSIENSGFSN